MAFNEDSSHYLRRKLPQFKPQGKPHLDRKTFTKEKAIETLFQLYLSLSQSRQITG